MVQIGKQNGVTTLILNRPKQRNALDAGVIQSLIQAIEEAEADDATRCLVIRGAGGNFCAGRDLSMAPERDLGAVLAADETWTKVNRLLHRMTKPSVAVVEGYAVAGGFTLAMICDFVLAEEGAHFGALEMRQNFPAAVNTPVLSSLIGPRLALEFLLFGDLIPARRLYEVGLVNRLVEGAEALSQVVNQFVGGLGKGLIGIARLDDLHRHLAGAKPGNLGSPSQAAQARADRAVQLRRRHLYRHAPTNSARGFY